MIYLYSYTIILLIDGKSSLQMLLGYLQQKTNSVALVRKRTIPTKRPPLVGEVSGNFSR
jgi:hypothetical protein